MALTKSPCFSLDARGRLGGLSYSRCRAGNTAKPWYPQCNSKTPWQTDIRANVFSVAQFEWQNQPLSVVQLWIDYSKSVRASNSLGESYTPSPRQCFVRLAMNRLSAGLGVNVVPPVCNAPDYHPTISVVWSSNGIQANFLPEIPVDHAIIFYQRRLARPVNLRPKKGIISHVFYNGDPTDPLLSPPPGPTGGPGRLPAFAANSWIQVHARAIDNHGLSTPVLYWPIYVPA